MSDAPPLDLSALVEPVQAIAREAGRRIMEVYAGGFSVTAKADQSPVTEADTVSYTHLDVYKRQGFGNRGNKFRPTASFDDPLGRLTTGVQFPMPDRAFIGRVENRAFKERLIHGGRVPAG